MAASYPWKDGNYKGEGFIEAIILTGNKAIPTAFPEMELTFELGDFGPAEKEVVEISGQKNNTVRITFVIADKERERLAVVTDEGKAFYFKSSMANVAVGKLEWMTAEEAAMVEGQGDPIDAPPGPHTVEPGRVGKLVWISGPPGLGKSTSAQLLARHHGYVYYEGDCFFGLKNPFIPPDVAQPTLAVFKQPKLLGEGLEARRSAVTKTMKELQAMWAGKEWEQEGLEEGYQHLFADIARQRARVGGDWAVATILHSRQLRDLVRQQFKEVDVVVLDMEVEDMVARVEARAGGDTSSADFMKVVHSFCEPVGKDEPQASTVNIDTSMSPDDVLNSILKIVN